MRKNKIKEKNKKKLKICLDKLCKKAYVKLRIYRGVEQPGSSSGS